VAVGWSEEGERATAGRRDGRVGIFVRRHGVDELILSARLMLMGGGGGSPLVRGG
jgi:hypothetical protein